jgi:hypothetical protein
MLQNSGAQVLIRIVVLHVSVVVASDLAGRQCHGTHQIWPADSLTPLVRSGRPTVSRHSSDLAGRQSHGTHQIWPAGSLTALVSFYAV